MIQYVPSEKLVEFVNIFNKINGKKLGVVGSRILVGEIRIDQDLKYILDNSGLEAIVSGGAKGVDTSAEEFAHDNKLHPIIHMANWRKHGKKAGILRNVYIARDCDALLAYIQGESKGTKNTISQVEKLKKPLLIVEKKE